MTDPKKPEQFTFTKPPKFEFPEFRYHTPIPSEFYPIAKDYAKFLIEQGEQNKLKAWDDACNAVFSRYQTIIKNKLDQSKYIFRGILENMYAQDSQEK